jgi:predicted RNase H-like nuclease (RuvC/YqgF family)
MKKLTFGFLAILLITISCNSSKSGMKEVKTPFKGSKYESNLRYFRSVASGESINLETAKNKAMLNANQRLASSVQTEIKNVTENYQNERKVDNTLGDFGERFQQLTREVMSTTLIGSNLIEEKIFIKTDKTYQVWIAMELRKKEMYKRMKQMAKEKNTLSALEKKAIEEMIDKSIAELDDPD